MFAVLGKQSRYVFLPSTIANDFCHQLWGHLLPILHAVISAVDSSWVPQLHQVVPDHTGSGLCSQDHLCQCSGGFTRAPYPLVRLLPISFLDLINLLKVLHGTHENMYLSSLVYDQGQDYGPMDDGDEPRTRAEKEDVGFSCLTWLLQLPGTWAYSAVWKLKSALLVL